MPKLIEDKTIYQAAVQEVLAKGYAGATMKRIARNAGVSELTLFRRYGTKVSLISSALASRMQDFLDHDVMVYTGDLEADLLRLVRAFANPPKEHSQLMMLILSEVSHYPELKEALTVPNQLMGKISQLVFQYQAAGMLCADINPLHVVGALVAPLIINATLRNNNPALGIEPVDLPRHVGTFLGGYRATCAH